MENTNIQNQPQQAPVGPTVSGAHIVNHSEEALRQNQLTMRELMEKINANIVVGDVVDDYEEDRQRTVEQQKALIQQRQEADEIKTRQTLEEEQRQREEEEAIKEKAEQSNLLSVVKGLSKKVTVDVLKGFSKSKTQEVLADEQEEVLEYDDKTLDENSEEVFENKDSSSREEPFDTQPEREQENVVPHKKEAKPDKKLLKKQKDKPAKKEKPAKQKKTKIQQTITPAYTGKVIHDEYEDPVPEKKKKVQEPQYTPEELASAEEERNIRLRDEVTRYHEQTDFEEVAKFRSDLERLSADSYYSVSVYAACIIDKDFTSLSIIKNVSRLAELIADSDDNMDFYFAYIITNKGVQHYGSDEAISDASKAMEALRDLFILKKGRVTVEQIQKIRELQIFQTIYYDDNSRPMRR